MQPSCLDQGLAPTSVDHDPRVPVQEQTVPSPLADDRDADLLEAHSIKWNVARIVRLSSGRFALLTHYRAGALDIIKVGTIEEIVDHIPTAEQCIDDKHSRAQIQTAEGNMAKRNVSDLLADIGLI